MNAFKLVSPRNKKVAFAVLAGLILPISAAGQTTYHDPQGRYDVQVPSGWQVAHDNGVDQITIRNGSVQAILAVVRQNQGIATTGQEFVDTTAKEFRGQCPTFQKRQNGAVTLAGWPGVYSLFVCNDTKSPTVAETSSALTANHVLIGFTMIAPLVQYYAILPTLDGIRNSLKVAGEQRPPAPASGDSQAMAELKKACIVGVFAQVECARQIGILLGKEELPGAASAPAAPAGSIYRDGQGRFSVQVPKGWSAIPQGESGTLGVELRSGSNWIDIIPAEAAASTDEVVIHQEQKVAARSNSSRKIPFGSGGIIQLFGHGIELSYDHFSAATPQGEAVETYIGGVSSVSGASHTFLLVIAGFGAEEKDRAAETFLSVGQSFSLPAR